MARRNSNRAKMTRAQRAKQFAPFAALKGFETALREKERVVLKEDYIEKEKAEILDKKLRILNAGDMVKITYKPDSSYHVKEGMLNYVNEHSKTMKIVDTVISLDEIILMEAEKFKDIDFIFEHF